MTPWELTATITAIANAISKEKSNDDLLLISSILLQLGDTLATIVAQRERLERCNDKNPEKHDGKN